VSRDVLWVPPADLVRDCGLTRYLGWLRDELQLDFEDYASLWRWSVDDPSAFWRSVWRFGGVVASANGSPALADASMPGASWFPGARLNYAENLLQRVPDDAAALVAVSEDGEAVEMSGSTLRREAGALADRLRSLGVEAGDCVVAYLPSRPESVVGLVACASIGAIWSVCSPEYGLSGVVSRFRQLRPKVLIAADGYRFGARAFPRRDEVVRLAGALDTVEHVIWVPVLAPEEAPPRGLPATTWADATDGEATLVFEQLPFDHPLWVLFSSGTTGPPKGVVHGHGGIVLEQLKAGLLHYDLRPGERFLLVATTSWVLWNILVSSPLAGAVPVLFDGNPAHPDMDTLWRVAAQEHVNMLGMGAGYLHASMKAGLRPGATHDLSALRQLFSTGSPLTPDGYRWIYRDVDPEIWLSSSSGGTDVCTGFVGGVPLLPVRLGRLQAPQLGVAVEAWNEHGDPVVNETGELVVTKPMPSMPLYLWGDHDGRRLHESYYATYPGVWRHGDYIEFDTDGSSIIHGRSDSTLNRRGIRLGTAEIYAVVEALPSVTEALVVGAELADGGYYMPLFVVLADDADEQSVRTEIIAAIRDGLSPRHVPDEIVTVPAVPHTRTGKKLEVPVKRLLQGAALADAVDVSSVDDPGILTFFEMFARDRHVQSSA
jgi:acetoacetyl-CoA synthetase